jgi:hypothetical protein
MNPPCRALTVVAPLDRDDHAGRGELRALLAACQADVTGRRGDNTTFLPGRLPDTHFLRVVVVEDPDYDAGADRHGDGPLPPVLVWESNHDGRPLPYLRAAARAHGDGFDAVFARCPGYPGAGDPDRFARWMRTRSIPHQTFYCAYRGVPKREVDAARAVHAAIRAYLDRHRARLVERAPAEIAEELRAYLRGDPALDLRDYHRPLRDLLDRAVGYLRLVRLVPQLRHYHRWKRELAVAQQHEPVADFDRPVHGKLEAIAQEDFVRQNQLTHLVDVKPGWLRRFNLRAVMQVIEAEARGRHVHGELGGIRSIHFARWVLLEDPRALPPERRRDRLLFFSNYDFSWDAYLGEFIDRQAKGLTAVWSNTVGFPETEGLHGKGALDEERFKAWTRQHQLPTDLWWSGVPEATVDNVRDSVWIRRQLLRTLSDEEIPVWLRRL